MQEVFDARANVVLPIASSLKVALGESVCQQQRILIGSPNDIGGWAEKASDRDWERRLRLRSDVCVEPFVPT